MHRPEHFLPPQGESRGTSVTTVGSKKVGPRSGRRRPPRRTRAPRATRRGQLTLQLLAPAIPNHRSHVHARRSSRPELKGRDLGEPRSRETAGRRLARRSPAWPRHRSDRRWRTGPRWRRWRLVPGRRPPARCRDRCHPVRGSTGISLPPAAAATFRPVRTLPVKKILSGSASTSAEPTSPPPTSDLT